MSFSVKDKLELYSFLEKYKRISSIIFIILVSFLTYQLVKPPLSPVSLTQDKKIVKVYIAKPGSIKQTVDIIGTVRSSQADHFKCKIPCILKYYLNLENTLEKIP